MKDNPTQNEIYLSAIIPIFNEQENILELHRRLSRVLFNINPDYEIIFVDDGSQDNSLRLLKKLHQQNPKVKIISFSRNFGHHIAITAGIDYCQGKAVILMDGDLQDPPEEIPKLYERLQQGTNIVYAIRETREDSFFKKINSKIFHWLFKILGNVEIGLNSGIFRIMDRRAINALKQCREKSRFITALVAWTGFSCSGVLTKRHSRYRGTTKYNFFKSLKLAADSITSFSYFPLKIASYLGFLIALLSAALGVYILIKKIFFGLATSGYASLMLSILFLGSIQLIMIGILGSYIGRIYTEAQNRPLYIIKENIGL